MSEGRKAKVTPGKLLRQADAEVVDVLRRDVVVVNTSVTKISASEVPTVPVLR